MKNQTEAPSAIELACEQYLDAQLAMRAAKELIAESEEKLIAELGVRDEGQKTHNINGSYKVTLKGVINRSLDKAKWEEIVNDIPSEMHPVSYEPKLDIKGVKWLEQNHPEYYRTFTRAMKTSKGKTGVKVEVIE